MRALESLRIRVTALHQAGFRQELAQVLGAAAMKQTQDGFVQSRDPYGRPWAALKVRRGRPLRDTGAMAASVNFQVKGGGFRLSIPKIQAGVHQRGATIVPRRARRLRFKGPNGFIFARQVTIPKRQMVPEQQTGGLGDIWTQAFDRAAGDLIRRALGKPN